MTSSRLLSALATAFVLAAASLSTSAQLNFEQKTLSGVSANNPTSIDIGPDGRAYLSVQNGLIYAYTVVRSSSGNYSVTATETIDIVQSIPNHNDDGSPATSVNTRQVTGILVKGTAANPVIYVSSSDPRIGGGPSRGDLNLDTNSGTLSRLSWTGSEWLKVDLIRGLPRSEENHANNGMSLDESTNTLYLTVGGFTNAGAPCNNFAFICEYAYSACIVRVDLDALNSLPLKTDGPTTYLYDLPTLDDPTRSNVNGITDPSAPGYVGDIGDPFGGNDGLNMAKLTADSPVQIYSAGYRNAYDVTITEAGRVYTWDNGPNAGWGGHPDNEGGGSVTNRYLTGEPGSNGPGPNDARVNNRDGLHLIGTLADANCTYYGGHPNPVRANPSGSGLFTASGNTPNSGVFRTSVTGNQNTSLPVDWPPVPSALADTREGDFQNPGVSDQSLYTITASTNGLVEYTSNSFGGQLKGNLLAASFNGNIYRVKLNAQGTIDSNADVTSFASGFGATPLDLTAQGDDELFPGTIWSANYGADTVVIFEPADAPNCSGVYSFTIDDDNDGFSNADEVDSGTNPCNNADRPNDADGDLISDLNDPDDDNDGIPDTADFFALDPLNGLTTTPPLDYELLNGSPGTGFYGLGFTGLMHDGVTDYRDLIADEDNSGTEIIAGGASGLFSINGQAAGSSFGSARTQKNGFQFGLNVMETTPPFTILTNLVTPVLSSSTTRIGLFTGTGNQDDYVNVSFRRDGFIATREIAGVTTISDITTNNSGISEAVLRLSVDPAAGTVQPSISVNGGTRTDLGSPFAITGDMLTAMQREPALAVGLALQNPVNRSNQNGTWDSIQISYDNAAGCEGVWSAIDTPAGSIDQRHEADYLKLDGKFYLIGGRGDKELNIYNPATGQWSTGTKPPIRVHHFQGLVFDNELWVAGAFQGNYPLETPVNKVLIYNPGTDSWRDGPTIPRPRGGGGLVTHGGKIYLVCGITNGHRSGHVAWLDCYDPATGTWTQLPDAPRARDHFRAVVVGDRIYNAAGRRSADQSSQGVFGNLESRVDYYDISMGQWFTLPVGSNIPTPRAGNAAINFQNKVLVIGGESTSQSTAHAEVEILDPNTEEWTTLPPLLQGRHGTGVIEHEGDLYIASGSGGRGGGPELQTHEKYCACHGADFDPVLTIDQSDTFAQVTSGQTQVLTLPISNTSAFPISIGSIKTDSPLFTITNAVPQSIPAGGSHTVQITFDPGTGAAETFASKLTIVSNVPDAAITVINLTGERYIQPVTSSVILAINSGGNAFTAADGQDYEADRSATGGTIFTTTNAIAGTDDDSLYQSERWGTFSYAFTVPDGDYELTLKFAEIFAATNNPSVMDVSVEGNLVLDNLNLIDEVGRFAAYDRTFPVTVADGQLNLTFTNVSRYAKLSAFTLAEVPATTSLAVSGTPPTGSAPIGGSDIIPVVINNPSDTAVTISSITASGSAFTATTATPLTIAAGDDATINVTFAPTSGGSANFDSTLTILSDATVNPTLTLSLAGTRLISPPFGLFESSLDIGAVASAGTASFNSVSGVYTVQASGADIWGTADEFHFIHRRLTGDGSIIARVDSLVDTHQWAKSGVMIRESLAVGSKHAVTIITPDNGAGFQRRTTTDGSSSHTSGAAVTAPRWLRLTRSGNTFTASESTNGSNWTVIGSDTVVMGSQVYYGLALTSHADGTLTTSNLRNVSLPADTDDDGITNLSDPDDDNDTIPDSVEIALGLNPLLADSDSNGTSDADEDSDHDGYTNAQEVLVTGTDPGDSASKFRMTFSGNSLSFPSRSGFRYHVEQSDLSAPWTPHPGSPFTVTSPGTTSMTYPVANDRLFFRIRIEPIE